MNKKAIIMTTVSVLMVLSVGVVYAAFSDKGKYTGSSFNVASADIKILNDVALGIVASNLVEEKPGPTFNNVSPSWASDYPIKIYNNATSTLTITSNAYYETINDPDELRSYIYCEILEWNDANTNGTVETGELGTSLGNKTLLKWKTEGITIGNINQGEVKGYILRFTTTSTFPLTKQGKSGLFDFEFTSVGQ